MQLTVGALARRTALTVRTLHHYDEIGLLKPSGRSEGGYRLYGDADVARLHAIQALRHLGLPLAEIGALLDGQQAAPERIVAQQIHALDQQIRHATELRDHLRLIEEGLHKGLTPSMDDWVQSLSLMATFSRYFSAGEMRAIFAAWGSIEQEWLALLGEVQACMDSGATHESESTQILARRWMMLMHRWMGGDMALIDRWGAMYRQEPGAHGRRGAPPLAMSQFMEKAVAYRLGLLQEHLGSDRMRKPQLLPDERWLALERAGRKLMAAGKPPTCKAARNLYARWFAMADESAGGDAGLRRGLLTLHEGHPLLAAGLPLSREVRAWLAQAAPAA